MKERFKDLKQSGEINLTLKNQGKVVGYWDDIKLNVLHYIKEVVEEYQEMGYTLTLRQMYYQIVSKDLIPNHDTVYKKLGKLKDELLYSGVIDWDVFVDRGRLPHMAYTEINVPDSLQRTYDSYNLNKQNGQLNHIELWTEKDAISGILRRAADPYTVRLVVNKGYTSSTAIYKAYERFIERIKNRQKIVILYFGDHDPSGLDMIRDIRSRLMTMFLDGHQWEEFYQDIVDWSNSDEVRDNLMYMDNEEYDLLMTEKNDTGESAFNWRQHYFQEHFRVEHIGLTMAQIEKYNPPPNPAKLTDPRAKPYIKKYGSVSWEVDALKPSIMTKIVEDKVVENMDMDTYYDVLAQEKKDKIALKVIIDNAKKAFKEN